MRNPRGNFLLKVIRSIFLLSNFTWQLNRDGVALAMIIQDATSNLSIDFYELSDHRDLRGKINDRE